MWIGQFSAKVELSVATVRFYVRAGLFKPKLGPTGGSRPYLKFSQRDLRLVGAIRMGQAMGLSLCEIKLLIDERRTGGRERMLETMTDLRGRLHKSRRSCVCGGGPAGVPTGEQTAP